jgi:cytochrome oxidase Cu insertion factor (SCO1/SenC/PrrC family)
MSKKQNTGWFRTEAGRRVIAPLALVGILLALATPLEADEDTRRLLQALWVDTPVRPAVASPFSLPDLNGTPIRLADLQGRIVMLYFWTTW